MTDLERFATEIRIAEMKCFEKRGFGHVGGALSSTDLIAALYGKLMKYDSRNPKWEERDYVVMSKGHSGPVLYATLALKGFFPMEWLDTLNEPGTRLPSHCDMNLTPGVDMTTGALGQGASTAAGMALALKINNKKNRVFCILGDGECNEGQVWEMALFAAAKKLDQLVTFVDYNRKQLDGCTDDILPMGDIAKKFEEFGWYAVNIPGNDPDLIAATVETALRENGGRPMAIVLNTVKGAGISAIEALKFNHHIQVGKELAAEAIAELERRLEHD